MSYAIRTYGLSKKFRRTAVLDGLNLSVPDGSIYGLVGPNGAGKTTTIKVLMNIYPPSGGRSEVLDADSRRLSPRQFAQIGYVSEKKVYFSHSVGGDTVWTTPALLPFAEAVNLKDDNNHAHDIAAIRWA